MGKILSIFKYCKDNESEDQSPSKESNRNKQDSAEGAGAEEGGGRKGANNPETGANPPPVSLAGGGGVQESSSSSEGGGEGCELDQEMYFNEEQATYYMQLYRDECIDNKANSIINNWQQGKIIGNGSFGVVYWGLNNETGVIIYIYIYIYRK